MHRHSNQSLSIHFVLSPVDETGPLVGATVVIVGTSRGTSTDVNGAFYLEDLQNGNVLQVSYIGYNPVEITYQGQTNEEILLKANANELDAVVVTALGIERQSKTLTYAAQTVGGEDVADIKSINMINSLQGKSAGLQITPNSTRRRCRRRSSSAVTSRSTVRTSR